MFRADGMSRREDYDGAIAILDLNREHFPKSSAIYLGLAQMYEGKDDIALVIQHVEKSTECGDIVQRQTHERGLRSVQNSCTACSLRSWRTLTSGSTTIRSGSKSERMVTARSSPAPRVTVVRASR